MICHPRRSGFTLIELLIVVAIIAFLGGLILAALSILKKMAHRATTMDMMVQITESMSRYLDSWPILGSTDQYGLADANGEPGFRKDPWKYIYKNNVAVGKVPFVDITIGNLVKMTGVDNCASVSNPREATHITDKWGRNPGNVLSWRIENAMPVGGSKYMYTKEILFRSAAGTPNDPSDDIGYEFKSDNGRFDPIKFSKDKPEDKWNINGDFTINTKSVHIDNRSLPP